MRAGKMDREITVQSGTHTVDEYGDAVFAWTDVATVRAQLIQQSTEEFISTRGADDETVVIFRIRHLDGVTTAHRVLFESRPHNIREVKLIGRRKGMELRCEEAQP